MDKQTFEIRLMRESDIPAVAELEKICFSDPWSEKTLYAELRSPRTVFFAAVEQDTLIGYAGICYVLDEGYINNVAVAPAKRRCGAGARLMEKLIAFGTKKMLRFLTLEVRESNEAAIALYRKYGFTEAGRRKQYYFDPVEDAILMTLEYTGKGMLYENFSN